MKREDLPEPTTKATEGFSLIAGPDKVIRDMKQTKNSISKWVTENPQAVNWLANFGLGFCANCVSIEAEAGSLSGVPSRLPTAGINQKGAGDHG